MVLLCKLRASECETHVREIGLRAFCGRCCWAEMSAAHGVPGDVFLLWSPVYQHVLLTQCACVLCGSENKQRLFPYTALTDWFL